MPPAVLVDLARMRLDNDLVDQQLGARTDQHTLVGFD
jgi:hypothetical protein